MSVYRDYYKSQAEKQKRQFEKPKRVKKFCWKLETIVEFMEGRCPQDGCPHRGSFGCLEVELVG